MNINRYNYEEYFLLYIDNELTIEQKKQVELFVKDNPDLEEELVMLQQSKLIPDDRILFGEKKLLLKDENNSFINHSNYEEWLVLYTDNELGPEEKMAVEKFTAAHTHVQKELGLFQQAKLQPEEELKFPYKNLLYRKEEKARIISIGWWRAAAAAILIIAAGVTIYSGFNKKTDTGSVPTTAGLAKPKTNQQQGKNNPVNAKEEQQTQIAVTIPVSGKPNKKREQLKKDNKKQPDNNLPELFNKKILADAGTPRERPAVVNEINANRIHESQISNAVVLNDKTRKQFFNDEIVTNPSPQTPDKRITSDKGVEYASNAENKRLRGFFRKATRLIERTTNINPANDDNRVLIGGMAINLK
jgi:hypothetical protein